MGHYRQGRKHQGDRLATHQVGNAAVRILIVTGVKTLKNEPDGGEALPEAFRRLHVDYVISSPGSEWPPIWEALARQKIGGLGGPTYMDCGHETLAVGVAVGYTQITGRPPRRRRLAARRHGIAGRSRL
jgi:hypothetical protein